MTELTFLIELLLNHKLPKPTKDAVALRISEIEQNSRLQVQHDVNSRPVRQVMSDSLTKIGVPLEAGNRDAFKGAINNDPPITQIAQTPAASAAMDYRAKLLAGAGKIMPGDKAKKF